VATTSAGHMDGNMLRVPNNQTEKKDYTLSHVSTGELEKLKSRPVAGGLMQDHSCYGEGDFTELNRCTP
jgi:hypothetical protein